MAVFGKGGLHSTSMADVIAESGMSAGAVYLYFASKEDLIEAVADEVFGQVTSRFAEVENADPPLAPDELVRTLLTGLTVGSRAPVRSLPLLLAVWSEGTRSDTIRVLARRRLTELRSRITGLLQYWVDAGHQLPAPAGEFAPVVIALMQGYAMQHAIGVAPPLEEYLATVSELLAATTAQPLPA